MGQELAVLRNIQWPLSWELHLPFNRDAGRDLEELAELWEELGHYRTHDGAPRVRRCSFTNEEREIFTRVNDGFPLPSTKKDLCSFDKDVGLSDEEQVDETLADPEVTNLRSKSKSTPDLHRLGKKANLLERLKKLNAPAKPKFLERLINGVSRPRLGKNGNHRKGSRDESGECTRIQPTLECDCECGHDASNSNVVCSQSVCLGLGKRTNGNTCKCVHSEHCCTSRLIGSSPGKKGAKGSKWSSCNTADSLHQDSCVCSQPTSPTLLKEGSSTKKIVETFEECLDQTGSRSAPSSPGRPGRSRFYIDSSNPIISPSKGTINRRIELLKRLPQQNVYHRKNHFAHTIMAKGYVKAMINMIDQTGDEKGAMGDIPEDGTSSPSLRKNTITESPVWTRNSFVQQIQSQSPNTLRNITDKSCDSCSDHSHGDNDTGFNSANESHPGDCSTFHSSTQMSGGDVHDATPGMYLIGADGVPQSPAELFDNSWSDSDDNYFSDDSDSEDRDSSSNITGKKRIPLLQTTQMGRFCSFGPMLTTWKEEEPDPEETHPGDKLYKIVHELVKTERAYVHRLHLVDQVFHFRITMANSSNSFIPADVITQMFSNIKSIYQLHHDFILPKLEERLKDWDNIPRIGDLMKRNAPFLKLYSDYVKNFDRAMTLINQWYEKSPKFLAIVQEIHKLPDCGALSIQHHMLEPIQRVPRYELLLKDYLKHLPEDSPDRKDTQDALQLVTTAACHSNEAMNKIEKFRKLLEIHQSLGGAVDLISPTRELIKEGRITKISARREKTQERYIFLFNDLLLICSEHILGTYKIRAKLDVEGMEIMEGDNTNIPFTFKVTSKQKIIEFQASSLEESDEWKSKLWATVQEFTRRKESRKFGQFKHLQNAENYSPDDTNLGKRAPEWIRDEAVTMCMQCTSPFTTFRRRHHCRACGRVICGKCSSKKVQLTYDNKPLNRVCDNCHQRLKDGSLENKERPGQTETQRKKKILQVRANDPSIINGYLLYSSDKGKSWTKRCCAIHTDFVLYFFKAHQDVCAITSLPLPGYNVCLCNDLKETDQTNVIKLYHKNQSDFYFQAEDKIKARRWLKVLEKVVMAELPEDMALCRFSSDSDNSEKSDKSEISEKSELSEVSESIDESR